MGDLAATFKRRVDRGTTCRFEAAEPELPMVWVQAATAGELADAMWRAEDQMNPGDCKPGWP
jgi:hypothetical protein